jgi:hypothetical protein
MPDTNYVNLTGSMKLGGDYDPLKHLALINPIERRALGLRFALDKHNNGFDREGRGTDAIIEDAKLFAAYIAGEE